MIEKNVDPKTVEGFGAEWSRFDQSNLDDDERREIFESYFSIFPWHRLPSDAVGFDAGCGSGRWARVVAPRVGKLNCIDASPEALDVARRNLGSFGNCEFANVSVAELPFADDSMDFGYSLGVLHHIPDTADGIARCVSKIKPGGVFLVYLYYAFDNRPAWFFAIWKISDVLRRAIASLPLGLRHVVADLLAVFVYWPLARFAKLLGKVGVNVEGFPLSVYRDRSFYVMRTDSLDRFGTQLESRFTRDEIAAMMSRAGLTDIEFSDKTPFWCAVGIKK